VTAGAGEAGDSPAAATPSLTRRMACFCYEAMLLFGIALVPGVLGAIFFAQTGQHHPLQSGTALRIYALVLDAIYFVGLWSTRGQTLAMQTWRIRVVPAAGGRLSQGRALLRFTVCCIAWLGVPTALASALHWPPLQSVLAVLAWFAIYPLLTLFAPGRQFWHDLACGTRLVVAAPRDVRPRPR